MKGGGGGGSSGGGSTLSSVASIMGMKGITITKDTSSPSSNGMPNSLINIKVLIDASLSIYLSIYHTLSFHIYTF